MNRSFHIVETDGSGCCQHSKARHFLTNTFRLLLNYRKSRKEGQQCLFFNSLGVCLQHIRIFLEAVIVVALLTTVTFAADRSITINSTESQRLALIIGNSDYATSPLKNPVNDARDMSKALKKLGFQVIYEEDATRRKMDDAVRSFYQKLRNGGGVGLFYYAGHGMQVKGRNYLIPIGARIETESDVEHESIDIARILGKMEDAGNPVNIVILDACRDNPFAKSFRSARGGLARMDAPTGTIVAYATAPESVAADGNDQNGIYTKHLLKALIVPGLTIEQVFKTVRNSVINETDSRQIPWESTSLRGDFYFSPARKESGCVVECFPAMKSLEELLPVSQLDLTHYMTLKKQGGTGTPEFAVVLRKIVCDFRSIEASLQEQYETTGDESAKRMQINTARTRQKYETELCDRAAR
jgi:hypothetical protein